MGHLEWESFEQGGQSLGFIVIPVSLPLFPSWAESRAKHRGRVLCSLVLNSGRRGFLLPSGPGLCPLGVWTLYLGERLPPPSEGTGSM